MGRVISFFSFKSLIRFFFGRENKHKGTYRREIMDMDMGAVWVWDIDLGPPRAGRCGVWWGYIRDISKVGGGWGWIFGGREVGEGGACGVAGGSYLNIDVFLAR
jgi:hypothetical protein